MKRNFALLLAVLFLFVLSACGGKGNTAGKEEADPASSETNEMRTTREENQNEPLAAAERSAPGEEAAESPYFFLNNILVTKDVTMAIKDYKVLLPGENGNESGEKPVIAFWYDTTNLSDKEGVTALIAWHAMFRVYQDTDPNYYNELKEAPSPDSKLAETENAAIKQNGTVSNAIAYYLDSLTVPVLIKATRGSSGEPLGEQEYLIDTNGEESPEPAEVEPPTEDEPESIPESEPEAESEPEPSAPALTAEGFRPEFKVAMDAYEAFYDEYCDFLAEFNKNPTSQSLLSRYTDFLKRAEEFDEKFDEWDGDKLNDAELKYYLEVQNRVMQKLLSVPEPEPEPEPERVQEPEPEPVQEPTAPTLNADGLRQEFKEAMDAYEAFYDEYCEFMKEYMENPMNLSLLTKYSQMLEKSEEVDKAFEAWDGDTLNNAEMKYYWEVYNRVMQKLLSIY